MYNPRTTTKKNTKERAFNAAETRGHWGGTSSQEISFELNLKNEQAFVKTKRDCESGEGNPRLIEMKQNKTNERQHDKTERQGRLWCSGAR